MQVGSRTSQEGVRKAYLGGRARSCPAALGRKRVFAKPDESQNPQSPARGCIAASGWAFLRAITLEEVPMTSWHQRLCRIAPVEIQITNSSAFELNGTSLLLPITSSDDDILSG